MINLEFQSLVATDFKMFVGKRLSLYLGGTGFVFVRGRNEAEPDLSANDVGKTSLFDALTWCLFGRTVDNLRNPDVKPWTGGKGSPSVFVSVKRNDTEHMIVRMAFPNKLLLDDKEVTQQEIDELLGFNFTVFVHTILLGQAQPLFLDLKPTEKMDLFSQVLDLDRWEVRSERAGAEVKLLELDLATAQGELTGAEGTLAEIETLLKTAKTEAEKWEAERSTRVKDSQAEIADLAKKLKNASGRKEAADLAYDSAMTELNALIKDHEGDEAELLECAEKLQTAKLELEDLQRQGATIEAELDALGETDTCPVCQQSIKGTSLDRHKLEMQAKLAILSRKADAQKKTRAYCQTKRDMIGKRIGEGSKQREQFRNKAANAQATLDLEADAVVRLTTQINNLKDNQKQKADEVNPYRNQVQVFRKKQGQLTTQLEKLDKEVLTTSRLIQRSKVWVKGFKEIKLYVLEEALQELEMATNALLPESGLVDWRVKYAIERETNKGSMQRGLHVTVLSPANDGPVKWEVWGGGVRQRLKVVSTLALSEVLLERAGIRTNLEILDEPTRGISALGVQHLCEFLADRAKQQNKCIFYVDHAAVESSRFTDVVTVVKTETGSYIEG